MEPDMSMDAEIGEIARRVQTTLGCRGEMTPSDIQITVDVPPRLLGFALGWLACEDKVEIVDGEDGTKVRLKVN
jgi:winged helix-turn-helix protein DUF2582